METVAWIGCSIALFSGILIAVKINRSVSDKLLSAWLFLMAVEFATFGIDRVIFGDRYLLSNPFFLFNPAMYLYVRSLTEETFKLRWTQLMHLLPYIFFEGMAYVLNETRSVADFTEYNSTLWFRIVFIAGAMISWIGYSFISILKVHKHRVRLVNEFSTIESYKKITWVLFVLVFYIVIWIGSLAMALTDYFTGKSELIPVFTYSVLLVLTFVFSFYGLKQQTIFAGNSEENNNGKYMHSRLSPEIKSDIYKKLQDYFSKHEPYLDSELTINRLSELLNIPRHSLTEVINTQCNCNFYQFVNSYRVNAVKKKLNDKQYKHFSIEAIGYESGFNSKSAFFSVFKNITGMTPLQYRNEGKI